MGKYQRMDRIPWSILGRRPGATGARCCALRCSIAVMGFEVLFPWLRYLLSLLPGLVGEPYLGQKNLASILHHPTALLLLLFIVLLAALFVCIEIVGLFVYCERGWRRESLTVWNLIKETALRMRSLLSPKRLAVLLLFPPMALSVFALTSGYLKNVKVPEFILEFFAGNPALSLLFSVVVLLSNLLLLTYLYGFPSLLFGGETFLGSGGRASGLLRREKRRTAQENRRLSSAPDADGGRPDTRGGGFHGAQGKVLHAPGGGARPVPIFHNFRRAVLDGFFGGVPIGFSLCGDGEPLPRAEGRGTPRTG